MFHLSGAPLVAGLEKLNANPGSPKSPPESPVCFGTRRENGLPAGPVDSWLHGDAHVIASLGQGGVYFSRDEGMNWNRVDEDAERGRTTGLVHIGQGNVIVGSQSEGVLHLDLGSMK